MSVEAVERDELLRVEIRESPNNDETRIESEDNNDCKHYLKTI